MHLNQEQIKAIEDMAYLLIKPELIAINIEVDEQDFIDLLKIPGSQPRKAYYKGYIRQLMELRRFTIKSAGNGSNPSIEQLIAVITEIETKL